MQFTSSSPLFFTIYNFAFVFCFKHYCLFGFSASPFLFITQTCFFNFCWGLKQGGKREPKKIVPCSFTTCTPLPCRFLPQASHPPPSYIAALATLAIRPWDFGVTHILLDSVCSLFLFPLYLLITTPSIVFVFVFHRWCVVSFLAWLDYLSPPLLSPFFTSTFPIVGAAWKKDKNPPSSQFHQFHALKQLWHRC